MKLVVNKCHGVFNINSDITKKYGLNNINLLDSNECHTNKKLIELIESGIDCSGNCSRLIVVEIPDEATDYYIEEYDGLESVIYAVDGKVHRI